MLDLLLKIINAISNELWSKWVLIALLGSGILVFFVTKAIQRKLGLGLKRTLRAFIRNNDSDEDPGEEGNISSIQALSTALASTIGVGNIAGVGTAIALGGPGAVFSGQAAVGGFAGSTIIMAARFGVARGLLSNEAGCGTAPMAHSSAKVKHPVEQGLFGISEVFIDTFIVCTFTALIILVTGSWKTGDIGVVLSANAFGEALGYIGEVIVTVSVCLFAYSTILGGSWYGETSITYLFGQKSIIPYKVTLLVLCFLGSILGSELIFSLTDLANGLAVLANVVSVVLLLRVVVDKTNDYFKSEVVNLKIREQSIN